MSRPYKIKRHKRIYRRSAGSIILRILTVVIAVALLFALGWALFVPVSNWISNRQSNPASDITVGSSSESITEENQAESQPEVSEDSKPSSETLQTQTVKKTAVFSTQTVLDAEKFAEALQKAKSSGYDSVMVELKDIEGFVNYPISVDSYADSIVTAPKTFDLASVVSQIKEAGLVPVASLYTFRDYRYPSANNLAATHYRDSDFLWVDNDPAKGGKAWLNPFAQPSQDYIRKIVGDACAAGFEQIVLDAVQFPEGYSLDMIDYGEHDGDDKNAFLRDFLAQMTDFASQQGVKLSARFPADSMLGGKTKMYFGSTASIADTRAVVDITPSVFGNGLQNEQISIPSPTADPYNTVKTAGAAIKKELPNAEIICYLNAESLSEENLESCLRALKENQIENCIIKDPALF